MKEQRGSIVLEAAIVMPALLFVFIAFSVMISICTAQMALHSAASQSVRQIAAHIYPVELAGGKLSSSASTSIPAASVPIPLPEWTEIAGDAAEWLPEPAGGLISSVLRGDWRPLQNMAATELGRNVIEPYVKSFADGRLLQKEQIRLSSIMLPDIKNKEEPYLALVLEYQFPVRLPFYKKPIILREQAVERVWISDAAAAHGPKSGESSADLPITIVTIEPTPIRPGQKAKVIVKTEAGAAVSLSVVYKSGESKAKHLGEAKADQNGFVEWSWHVSGNTTPGIWSLEVKGISRQGHASKHFTVEKKVK
ncbi:hypothetical protein ACFQZE_11270 [Paenibacillus sp. GCM10027627]